MHTSTYINKTIALAGVFQACELIKQLSWHGKCDPTAFTTCMRSLLSIDSAAVLDIYEDLHNLRIGLHSFNNFLEKKAKKDLEIARYVFSLLYLENKLTNRDDLIKIIRTGTLRANHQLNIFSLNHENVIANFAGIYLDTLSTLSFRIQIVGSEVYLNNLNISNKIRALLLAGIRSAVLWRQLGGTKLHLFFRKKNFLACSQELIKQLAITKTAVI